MAMTIAGFRLLVVVAERGSLSAAAHELGYTQSGVSRQLAALEREAGRPLVERGPFGARLTSLGQALLPQAQDVLRAVEQAEHVARGAIQARPFRLGVFISAGAALLPHALPVLAESFVSPVRTLQSTSPALLRGVRSGRLDAALVVSRAPFRSLDDGHPALAEQVVGTMTLQIAVATNSALGRKSGLRLSDLAAASWIHSSNVGSDPALGVWPSLPGRPEIAHRAADWLTKLNLVGAGLGITTVAPILATILPPGVRLLDVLDPPAEQRRLTLISLAGRQSPAVETVFEALSNAFADLTADPVRHAS